MIDEEATYKTAPIGISTVSGSDPDAISSIGFNPAKQGMNSASAMPEPGNVFSTDTMLASETVLRVDVAGQEKFGATLSESSLDFRVSHESSEANERYLLDMTSEQFCQIAANVAVIGVANTPPEAFLFAGASVGSPAAAGIGLGLAIASEFLSASEAAQGLTTDGLELFCNLAFDAVDSMTESGVDFDPSGWLGTGVDNNETSDEIGSNGGDLDAQSEHREDSSDAGVDSTSSSDTGSPGDRPNEWWSGGGGEFSGSGATGSWENDNSGADRDANDGRSGWSSGFGDSDSTFGIDRSNDSSWDGGHSGSSFGSGWSGSDGPGSNDEN